MKGLLYLCLDILTWKDLCLDAREKKSKQQKDKTEAVNDTLKSELIYINDCEKIKSWPLHTILSVKKTIYKPSMDEVSNIFANLVIKKFANYWW